MAKPKKTEAAEAKPEQRQEAKSRGKEPARLRVRFEKEIKPEIGRAHV